MNYISIEFIIFLFIIFIIYYLIGYLKNKKVLNIFPQWGVLLIASLFFYGYLNYVYLIYILISSIVSFICGYLVQHQRNGSKFEYIYNDRKRLVYERGITAFSIIFNVFILLVLKYYNFFASSINSLANTNISTFNFIIPLGISFYTFSLIAYNFDSYKRKFKAENNLLKFILFVSYFPKVLQGPISNYNTMMKGELFENHKYSEIKYSSSFLRISIGLIKKVAIANVIGLYVDGIYDNIATSSSVILLLGTILYSIQLYCDFSGFIDMSIGISGLFGIKLEENFDTPYLSSSIQEFWRRWHITLGSWLRNYIYIPLGGNRVSKIRWVINTLVIWLISGIWHGANWTYIIWGLYFGVLLVISKLFAPLINRIKNKLALKDNIFTKSFAIIRTFILVTFGWIFFRSSTLLDSFSYIRNLFSFKLGTYNLFETMKSTNIYFIIAFLLILLLIIGRIYSSQRDKIVSKYFNWTKIEGLIILVFTCLFFIFGIYLSIYMNSIGGGESSFIYFDF